MYKNIRRLGASEEGIVITIMSHRRKDLLSFLSISSSFCMKLTVGTLVIGNSLLRMKLDFTFVMLVSLKLDRSVKMKNGSDKGVIMISQKSNGYLDMKGLTAGI